MIAALERLDKRTAGGILARAALAIEEEGNPAATMRVDHEHEIRASIFEHARAVLGINPVSYTREDIEKITDLIDIETEQLLGTPDTEAAFERLIQSGHFPSDLYDIEVIKEIRNFHGKEWEAEKSFIERTVREPEVQQHFGPPIVPEDPYLISLFARRVITPYPYKNFTMLVAGQRGDGKKLHVHQAWRLYSSQVDLHGTSDLVEWLRRFSDVYGADILVDGKRGHFFLSSGRVEPRLIHLSIEGRSALVTVTQFGQNDPVTKRERSALVVAINLDKYRETLKRMEL